MNKAQARLNRTNTLNLIKRESLSSTREGCSKCWRGVTYNHWRVMSDIVWKLVNQDYSVYTEVEFTNNKGRADIVAIDHTGQGYVIEVLHTESDERYESKLSKYPEEFIITSIKTKDFDINTWDL